MPKPASPDTRELQVLSWHLLVSTWRSSRADALEIPLLDQSQKLSRPNQEIPAPRGTPTRGDVWRAPAQPQAPPTEPAGGGHTTGQRHRLARPEPPASDWLPGTRGLPEAWRLWRWMLWACQGLLAVQTGLEAAPSSSGPAFSTRGPCAGDSQRLRVGALPGSCGHECGFHRRGPAGLCAGSGLHGCR